MNCSVKGLIKRALRGVGILDATPAVPTHERRQQLLRHSWRFFRDMAQRPGIAQVSFRDDGCVVTLADERRYFLDPDIKAARLYNIPFTGTFEPDETAFVGQQVRPGQVCIDVGANFGWFTILLAQLTGDTGAVHAFEPVADTCELLRRNVALNGCAHITVNALALDERAAQREIFVPDIGVSGSFALHAYREGFDTQIASTITLDSYVESRGLNRVDFIKADIEGAELHMLRGAVRTLERFHPVLMLEVQAGSTRLFGYEPADLFAFLAEYGYRPHLIGTAGQTVPLEGAGADLPAYNFVFHPQTQAGRQAA